MTPQSTDLSPEEPTPDQPQGGESPTVESAAEILTRVIEWMNTHVALTEGKPVTLSTLSLLPSTQQCQTIAIELQNAKDAALAELERARKDAQDLRNRDNYRENLILEIRGERDQLRADLAAAREERDEARELIVDLKSIAKYRAETVEEKMREIAALTARAVEAERERDEAVEHAKQTDELVRKLHEQWNRIGELDAENKELRARVAGLAGEKE